MAFTPGDEVHVAAFGKGIVRETRNGGRYLVEVKGRAMVVGGSQLTAVARSATRRPAASTTAAPAVPDGRARAHVPASLDLHGMTVDTADAAVDTFLNDAILAGHAEVRIIHGRGGGRLKAAVHRRLTRLPPVRSYHLDPANPGVTIVML